MAAMPWLSTCTSIAFGGTSPKALATVAGWRRSPVAAKMRSPREKPARSRSAAPASSSTLPKRSTITAVARRLPGPTSGGGSSGAALYKFLQPGLYAYVNHNLIEAVNLGATAHIKVEGEWNNDLMEQVLPPTPYSGA